MLFSFGRKGKVFFNYLNASSLFSISIYYNMVIIESIYHCAPVALQSFFPILPHKLVQTSKTCYLREVLKPDSSST